MKLPDIRDSLLEEREDLIRRINEKKTELQVLEKTLEFADNVLASHKQATDEISEILCPDSKVIKEIITIDEKKKKKIAAVMQVQGMPLTLCRIQELSKVNYYDVRHILNSDSDFVRTGDGRKIKWSLASLAKQKEEFKRSVAVG